MVILRLIFMLFLSFLFSAKQYWVNSEDFQLFMGIDLSD